MREPKNQMLGTMEPPLMQLSVNDVRVTKNWILRILDENRPNFKCSPKIVGLCDFDRIFG